MRITGGKYKGLSIEVPRVSDLRPSQDIVREAIFNILGSINDFVVLDLYSGTGVLGIEALSRGAHSCDFIDHDQGACQTIKNNLRHGGLQTFADVYCEEAERFTAEPPRQPYDLIFLDPPYAARPRSVIRMMPIFMHANSVLIYLHGKHILLEEGSDREWIKDRLEVVDSRKYGATHLSFMRKSVPITIPEENHEQNQD